MESILGETQPEAAYFGSVDGNRGGYLVINMEEASEIPAKLEPLFQELGATVGLTCKLGTFCGAPGTIRTYDRRFRCSLSGVFAVCELRVPQAPYTTRGL
jgi:hypothetical protein